MILVLTQKAIEMMSSFVLEISTYFKEEKLKPFVVLFQSFSDTELFGVRKNMFQMVELYSFYKKKQKKNYKNKSVNSHHDFWLSYPKILSQREVNM